jgi:hypothetical protein
LGIPDCFELFPEGLLLQDAENFIRALENSFRYFGGVALT